MLLCIIHSVNTESKILTVKPVYLCKDKKTMTTNVVILLQLLICFSILI